MKGKGKGKGRGRVVLKKFKHENCSKPINSGEPKLGMFFPSPPICVTMGMFSDTNRWVCTTLDVVLELTKRGEGGIGFHHLGKHDAVDLAKK